MNVMLNGRIVCDVEIGGVDPLDYPDFCDAYVESARWLDSGAKLSYDELDELESMNPGLVFGEVTEKLVESAEFAHDLATDR